MVWRGVVWWGGFVGVVGGGLGEKIRYGDEKEKERKKRGGDEKEGGGRRGESVVRFC